MGDEIRVLLVDDHRVFRDALSRSLEMWDDIRVVGGAGSASEAIELVNETAPDVVLLDIDLADSRTDGIELCREIRSRDPEVSCLMLTGVHNDALIADAILSGAVGYVTKGIGLEELAGVIRRVSSGESLVDAGMMRIVIESMQDHADEPAQPALTAQEVRVLDLIGEGLTNREIAERLSLAEQTVKNYVSNVLDKLGVQSRLQAALVALGQDLEARETSTGASPPRADG